MFPFRSVLRAAAWLVAGSCTLLSGAPEPASKPFPTVEPIRETLPLYHAASRRFRNATADDPLKPMRLLLSRSRYWREDGHLDVVVQLGTREEKPKGRLEVTLGTAAGETLERFTLDPLPSPSFIFYPALPERLAGGSEGEITLKWMEGEQVLAQERQTFRVENFPEPVAKKGRVALTLPNRDGVHLEGTPVSVGVPFPRGALVNTAHLKLVAADAPEKEIPLQVKELARWSKYGSIKWVRCDFTADLAGKSKAFYLEYGPEITRRESKPMEITRRDDGFPKVDAGRLRFDDGLWLANQEGKAVKVVQGAGLNGAFVQHEDGTLYTTPANDRYDVEHHGAQKIVLRREGWYREAKNGREFCRYITRYEIFRDSPVVRLFHTWVFTGDGNRDRIRDMGWKFPLGDGLKPGGFLTSFDPEAAWEKGDYLVQFGYQDAEITRAGKTTPLPGKRTVGAACATGPKARLYFGAKDFWQNYPSELEFADGALWFHNWPRHNRPGRSSYDTTRLSEMEWTRNAFQVRFAHEGKLLDFRLPEELTRDPIRKAVVGSHEEAEGHWLAGKPESANAQGISRTEEMWLYLASPGTEEEAAAIKVLKALNDETLRAVVDPRWMAQSGAFYEIHPQDRENYPEEEKAFDLYTRAPARWIERLGLYGKWIYGDVATWKLDLTTPTVSLYRTYRSRHHGYPYSWVPYARSGESELLKAAETATRKLIDANYCHYVSPEVEERVGPEMHRRKGFWSRSLIPWTGRSVPTSRNYESKSDYLWHAWYLTGYERARENALDWGEETKREEPLSRRGALKIGGPAGQRNHVTLLKSYLDMYEATFDPWFLVAAHAIAEGHRAMGERATHFWVSADRDFLRFTGDPKHREHYMKYVAQWGAADTDRNWATLGGVPMIESNAYAWRLTGEEAYVRRVAHFVDLATAAVYDGDGPDYLQGAYTRQSSHKLFEGYYLQLFPVALAALHQSGQRPVVPIPNAFEIAAREPRPGSDGLPFHAPVVAFQKQKGEPLALRLRAGLSPMRGDAKSPAHYRVLGPTGEEMLSGSWDTGKPRELEIPATAPAGVYRLHVRYPAPSKLLLPVCATVDQPEVLELAPGESMEASRLESAFSFKVPAEVRRFWIEIEPPRNSTRIIVWNPAGKRAWDFHFRLANHPDGSPIRTEIEVRPEDAGQLWRITLPGSANGFRMDPQIPPVYATSPTRWFEPR